jgi:hypothetical protein
MGMALAKMLGGSAGDMGIFGAAAGLGSYKKDKGKYINNQTSILNNTNSILQNTAKTIGDINTVNFNGKIDPNATFAANAAFKNQLEAMIAKGDVDAINALLGTTFTGLMSPTMAKEIMTRYSIGDDGKIQDALPVEVAKNKALTDKYEQETESSRQKLQFEIEKIKQEALNLKEKTKWEGYRAQTGRISANKPSGGGSTFEKFISSKMDIINKGYNNVLNKTNLALRQHNINLKAVEARQKEAFKSVKKFYDSNGVQDANGYVVMDTTSKAKYDKAWRELNSLNIERDNIKKAISDTMRNYQNMSNEQARELDGLMGLGSSMTPPPSPQGTTQLPAAPTIPQTQQPKPKKAIKSKPTANYRNF